MKFYAAVILLFALTSPGLAKIFNRCSLAREMFRLGVPKSELPQWTCIAKHESSFNTAAIGPANTDGSHDYGIFQINSRYWCQPPNGGHSTNGCGVQCRDLLSDNISRSVSCARKVKSQQGWKAWAVWEKCSGKLPSIDDCFK
ncbi:lysozyme 1-like [Musca vetustissima]|uniref:lysozyme 1-like n=1 Tax=Musca vetustissima TaxID=27455 RepID=UPI002AB7778B|nr:lysozyme 1-like [Musca vetustissima]